MKSRLNGIPLTAAAAVAALAVAPAATAGPVSADPTPNPAVKAAAARAASVRSELGLSGDETLKVKSVVTDKDGTTHTRYDRTFKGLRVIGGDLIVKRSGNGKIAKTIKNASGKVAVASIAPTVKAERATAVAGGQVKGLKAGAKTSASKPELVIYAGKGTPRLAYEVVTSGIKADQTPTRLHTVVDANTGAVLTSWDQVVHATGHSQYSGDVEIETTNKQLKDSVGNSAADLNGSESGEGTIFSNDSDEWGDGTTNNRETAGVDALYGAQKTFEYFKNEQGRNGIWDNGKGAPSRVHYGSSYVNAFWDGSQMTYGDGEGDKKPLTELDVAAHEMGHGVTENTAGLEYSGDAGGLNESSSDIFGVAVEWYANNAKDKPDYFMGEEIDINGNGSPLRYMDKPSKDGRSYDCYSSEVSGADPHFSSGPLNHWYFMVSEGSGAKEVGGVKYDSPTCNNAAAVTGIGWQKAAKIWYKTLATKLTKNSTYPDARNGAIEAATELYGAGSPECAAVEKGFDAIEVPAGSAKCSGGGGGDEPTPAPTSEPTSTPTDEPQPQPTDEPTDQPTDEPMPTDEPTDQPTDEPQPQPTDEPTDEPMPTDEPTDGPTDEPYPTEEPAPSEPSDDPWEWPFPWPWDAAPKLSGTATTS